MAVDSPLAHTNMPAQPAATATAPQSNAPMMAPVQANATQHTSADQEPLTYNEQLNAADRLWKFKLALTIVLILTGIIGIGCIAWAVSTSHNFRSGYDYGYDSTWSLPWGLITLSISVLWCILCATLFLLRKRPVHPGLRVTMDLLLWLGLLVTALFTLIALFDVISWGEYGSLGYDSGFDSRYGEYVLEKNNTWVWQQDSDAGVTYERVCNGSTSSTYSYDYYYTDNPFKNCAEQDAYVNALWAAKPNRARTELTGVVCQFIGVLLHFVLFVWACVDCHRHRKGKVSKDAEKLAAGIVEKMVQSGAVVPAPGQAHTRNTGAGWQAPYHQLPSQNGFAGQGQGYAQNQQQQMYYQQPNNQQFRSPAQGTTDAPLPPLPARHVNRPVGSNEAGPSHGEMSNVGEGKGKGVAASYYEPSS